MEMKRLYRPSAGAFTLIELLVVITIIVILMGLLFPAFHGVQDQARKVQAKNDLTQIVTAVNAYYTEYGKYPVYYATPPANPTDSNFSNAGATVTNSGESFTNIGENSLVIDVLRNNGRATGTNLVWVQNMNPRGIAFLNVPTVKDASAPKSGVSPPTGSPLPGTWYGPWGTAYRIRIDTAYNNAVDGPYVANAGTTSTNANLSTGVIAWSLGNDGVEGATDFKVSDDVISWQ